ncbi:NlpC/P60 family protein [Phytohalomonas tamaricis]|uniref:hypothetical protein n=1 Tax=Phytohalomonas tamaricis TaxID=2081032 RepID=UPI000D0B7CD4|nr:hypothetical protein [Phytohalomonas tamaricis]
MDKQTFIGRVVGAPWVNRAQGPDAYDCMGLVIAYYREVEGVEVAPIPAFEDRSLGIADGYFEQVAGSYWQRDDQGVVFMAFQNDVPCHIGLVIDDRCVHAYGDEEKGGQVFNHPLRAIRRMYSRLEFWRYTGC